MNSCFRIALPLTRTIASIITVNVGTKAQAANPMRNLEIIPAKTIVGTIMANHAMLCTG